MRKWIISFCVLLFSLHNIHTLDITLDLNITNMELGFNYRGEYNRSLSYCQDFSAYGGIELNNRFIFKTGIALGSAGDKFDIKFFCSGRFAPIAGINLYLNIAYFIYSIPGYEMYSNAFLPYISYNGKRAGASLGITSRYTSFSSSSFVKDTFFSASGYVNFISNKKASAGIIISNFDDFYVGNFASFSFGVNGLYHLNEKWTLTAEIKLIQSGMDGLTSTFYGISWRGGAILLW